MLISWGVIKRTENEITIIEYCKKQFIKNEYKYKIPKN